MKLTLFGSPQIINYEQAVTGFISAKVRALLIYLAVTGRPHSRAVLAELLWADTPVSARKNLKKALSNLRSLPDIPLIEQADGLLTLDQSKCWVDVVEFVAFANNPAQHDIASLQRAAQLYQADFLAGFNTSLTYEFEAWALAEQTRLKEQMVDLLRRLALAHEQNADLPQAIAMLRRLLELEPWHEETHRQLMMHLVRTGDRTAALLQFENCRKVLAKELEVEPDIATLDLVTKIRNGEFERVSDRMAHPVSATPKHNLPAQATPLLGREQELSELSRLLADRSVRIVTILGAGGMGKTHLAVAAALNLVEHFANGICWVALAPLSDAQEIVFAIATMLGLRFQGGRTHQQQLIDFLKEKHLLLVLDNFEHLIEGVSLITDLLAETAQLSILVTSRQRLQISSETVVRLDGLNFPAVIDINTPDYPAVQLFLHYARHLHPTFQPQQQDWAGIVEICRLVDGMPLGILLAAAWSSIVSPSEIAREIGNDLGFLTTDMQDIPVRQRSMRIVFLHTWNRLSEVERAVFMRLSVFRGGCIREAAQVVGGATLSVLASLCDKALLWRTPTGRYEIHELLRQYAAQELEQSDFTVDLYDVYAAYYIGFLARHEATLKGGNQIAALNELNADLENLRRAWRWAVEHQNGDQLARAIESLGLFYVMSGQHYAGETDCRLAVEMLQAMPGVTRILVRVLVWQSWFGKELGHANLTRQVLEQSLVLIDQLQAEGLDLRAERGAALLRLGDFTWYTDVELASTLLAESLMLCRAVGDDWRTAHVLRELARTSWATGNLRASKNYAEESLAIRRALQDYFGLAATLRVLTWIASHMGNTKEALQYAEECHVISLQLRSQEAIAQALFNFGLAHLYEGDFVEAYAELEQSRRLAEELGNRHHSNTCDTFLAKVHLHLGQYRQSEAWTQRSLQTAAEIVSRSHRGDALLILASVCLIEGNFSEAKGCLHESLAIMRESHQSIKLPAVLAPLGYTERALGDHLSARQHLQEILQVANTQKNVSAAMSALPLAALLLMDEGEVERAVEIYAVARQHPLIANSRWFADVVGKQVTQAAIMLPPQTVAMAEARGCKQTLLATAQNLLHELDTTYIDPPAAMALPVLV